MARFTAPRGKAGRRRPASRRPGGTVFNWTDFETWCLSEHGKARATVYYNVGRLRSMQRRGLDITAFLASPAEARRLGNEYIAQMKRDGRTHNAIRTHQKALNWFIEYADTLRPNDAWKRWILVKEPAATPRSVDLEHVDLLWTAWTASDPYTTLLGRAVAYMAYIGNFRRGELDAQRLAHLKPGTAQIELPVAGKGSLSGLVEVPWSAFWPASPLMQYLAVRVDVAGGDWLWTVPWTYGRPIPRRVRGHGLYDLVVRMGQDLGVNVNFIRTKRRALTDLDELNEDFRVTQAKARHVRADNTQKYLGRVTGRRVRQRLAEAGVAGYGPEDQARAVPALPSPSTTPPSAAKSPNAPSGAVAEATATVARGKPIAFNGPPNLYPMSAENVDAFEATPPATVDAGTGPLSPVEVPTTMTLPTLVLKDGQLTQPRCVITPEASRSSLRGQTGQTRKHERHGATEIVGRVVKEPNASEFRGKRIQHVKRDLQPSLGVADGVEGLEQLGRGLSGSIVGDHGVTPVGRPGADVDASAPELPQQGILHQKAGAPTRTPAGAFTRTGVVAPPGARPRAVVSVYPATRQAEPNELVAALLRRRGVA